MTKVGARRGKDGSVLEASSPNELISAVPDNLRNLGLDVLDVVNLRNMFGVDARATDAIEAGLTTLADLQRQGLVRHMTAATLRLSDEAFAALNEPRQERA